MAELKIRWARLPSGAAVAIDQVGRGEECYCPACRSALVVRKGEINRPHFAHKSEYGGGCSEESLIHQAAKEIIAQDCGVALPPLLVWVDKYQASKTIQGAFFAGGVEREDRRFPGFVPDAVVYGPFGSHAIVEILFSHKVDKAKQTKIKDYGRPAIEISVADHPKDMTVAELRAVWDDLPKYWLHHPRADQVRQDLYDEQVELRARQRREAKAREKLAAEERARQEAEEAAREAARRAEWEAGAPARAAQQAALDAIYAKKQADAAALREAMFARQDFLRAALESRNAIRSWQLIERDAQLEATWAAEQARVYGSAGKRARDEGHNALVDAWRRKQWAAA